VNVVLTSLQFILTILGQIHCICLFGRQHWKMPTLAQFIESLTQEQTKLIQMGLMKDPKAHALTMHDGKGSSKQNRNEGYSKPFNDSLGSKYSSESKKKKKGNQCTSINRIMNNPHA
jgi:hypothetical protein